MKQPRHILPELSPAQREIMDVLWDRGALAASEVREILATRRDISRNTVRTMLERMEGKGWVTHREIGRTFLYAPAQPRQATVTQKVREVLDSVCGGSPEMLVNALLDSRGLTRDELARIRSILDDAQAKKATKKES
ncbi:MAG TPA: BlaI/MecI/CopY family transcriptional regulator [Planctomycetaceae bacterium]|jgi:predicted transcriptional regulator|nr:BlaI/MecI/CopY family transcriptional regulator [Planctomycetaceae bacterium]